MKKFSVVCSNCGKLFDIYEEEKKFLKKKKHFCSKSCANARHHSNETKQKISNSVKKSSKFIDGMEKRFGHKLYDCNECKKQVCVICGNEFEQTLCKGNAKRFTTAKTCSEECRSKYRSIRNKLFTGGFREGSVKNYKSGWYANIHCDSSWELAFLIYCKEHDMNIERCKEFRYYIDSEGNQRKFYPDFVVDGVIYEIKGYQDKNRAEKEAASKDVVFIYKNEMKPYLDYVVEKYGDGFIELYDSKDKNDIRHLKKCPTCGKEFIDRRTTYCSISCSKLGKHKVNGKMI